MRTHIYFDYVNRKLALDLHKSMRESIPDAIDLTIILSIKQILPTVKYYDFVFVSKMILENMGFTIKNCQIICNQGSTNIDQLMSSDLVFLSGGDPLSQIELIRELGLEQVIKDFDNGVIAGHSAGCMSMGEKIIDPPVIATQRTGLTREIKALQSDQGLGLDNLIVIPHLEGVDNNLKRVKIRTVGTWDLTDADYLTAYSSPIIGLLDGSALVNIEGEVYVLGEGVVGLNHQQILNLETETTWRGKRLILEKKEP